MKKEALEAVAAAAPAGRADTAAASLRRGDASAAAGVAAAAGGGGDDGGAAGLGAVGVLRGSEVEADAGDVGGGGGGGGRRGGAEACVEELGHVGRHSVEVADEIVEEEVEAHERGARGALRRHPRVDRIAEDRRGLREQLGARAVGERVPKQREELAVRQRQQPRPDLVVVVSCIVALAAAVVVFAHCVGTQRRQRAAEDIDHELIVVVGGAPAARRAIREAGEEGARVECQQLVGEAERPAAVLHQRTDQRLVQLVVDEAARREQVPKLAECELQGIALGVADGGAAKLEEEGVRAEVARRERLAEQLGQRVGRAVVQHFAVEEAEQRELHGVGAVAPVDPVHRLGRRAVAVGDVVEEDIEQRRRRSIGRRRRVLRGSVGRLARRRLVRVAEAGGEEEADEGVEHGRPREEEEALEPLLGRVRLLRVQHKPARHPHHHRPRRRRRRRRGRPVARRVGRRRGGGGQRPRGATRRAPGGGGGSPAR